MSTLKTNNVQVGQSVTATNNFTIYQPSSPDGTVRIGVGNSGATTADVLTANSSGNVGIGTTSPGYKLDVTGVERITGNADQQYNLRVQYGSTGFGIHQDDTIGYTRLSAFDTTGTTYAKGLTFATAPAGSATTERARIDFSGNLLVGTTSDIIGSASNSIQAKASGACHGFYRVSSSAASGIGFFYSDSGSTQRTQAYFRVDGGLANYSANNQNLSDERIKKDISLSGNYLNKICAIPVKNFRYKKDNDTSPITLGVIAQDVQVIAPELVCTDGFENEKADDGSELLSIYQTDLQYALMKCIQEQQAIIEELKADIAALKGAKN
jgi:hypothetical protein